MSTATWIGIGASILTGISMLPQLFKIYKEKKPADISYFMLVILITGLALWVCYGVYQSDYLIIVSNAFALLVNTSTLCLNLLYANRK